jgi:hypothetical protein
MAAADFSDRRGPPPPPFLGSAAAVAEADEELPELLIETEPSSAVESEPPKKRSLLAWAKAHRWGVLPEELEPEEDRVDQVVRSSPPWLVSLVVHMTVLVVMGLLVMRAQRAGDLALEVRYAEELGDQLDEMTFGLDSEDPADKQEFAPTELPPVVDPLAATPLVDLTPEGLASVSPTESPQIGLALSGRQAGMKDALLARYGGDATTQEAVDLALDWLARNQRSDGTWSLLGPYKDGATQENRQAAMAMALLAFQGDGHTHRSNGPYQRNVKKGWDALLASQGADGDFFQFGTLAHHRIYTHAQCTIALCELYGMTGDSKLRDPAQRAINYLVRIQAPEGGWRYQPGSDSDTSVTGWVVMALQSARMAKLDVPEETLRRVSGFLDSASIHGGSRYLYKPNSHETYAMTAEGLLCRQYLGWERNDSRLIDGVLFLSEHPIDWRERNVYYWYYATQVMHHMEGDYWKKWNAVMRQALPQNQVQTGKERGSWDPIRPTRDEWGVQAGRLYVTCLSTYMLEVYYRHLPLYSQMVTAGK